MPADLLNICRYLWKFNRRVSQWKFISVFPVYLFVIFWWWWNEENLQNAKFRAWKMRGKKLSSFQIESMLHILVFTSFRIQIPWWDFSLLSSKGRKRARNKINWSMTTSLPLAIIHHLLATLWAGRGNQEGCYTTEAIFNYLFIYNSHTLFTHFAESFKLLTTMAFLCDFHNTFLQSMRWFGENFFSFWGW